MNIEITDLDMILNYLETTSLEPHNDYSSKFTYKEQKILYKYIKQLQQENKILKENAENNDKVVDKVNWENLLLKKENQQLQKELEEYKNPIKYFKYANKNVTEENKQLKDELKNKPDNKTTLQDNKGNEFTLIQTERIDMQVELNKTIEKLFNNWNKLKEWVNKHYDYYMNREDYIGGRLCFTDMKNKMKELEGSDNQ